MHTEWMSVPVIHTHQPGSVRSVTVRDPMTRTHPFLVAVTCVFFPFP